ncbi:SRPBCC family protein [Nocardioides rotundus]|uniref:SRPBCC family protein n=1 Tax=Nocardioides rotundus TaxID=1774216 RepID=UPI001CBAADBD|nr:SRPBCC family protein [Nocardioides rotundus]UAL30833.1 SRPBCC family protein [Nocardioides rotundus]
MELRHEFTVPTGVQEAWDHFQDIASVATCFPGAQVTSVDGDTFSGQVKVKLGPIALVYTGQGEFVEKDASARRFVVDAKGRDKRGNGTAGAKVTLTMTEQAPDSTSVEVLTDLAVTGKPAQFGRGVMQDVSDKLLGQFTQCLERQVQAGGTAAASADSGAATASAGSGAAGSGSGSGDALSGAAPDSSSEGTPLAAAAASSSGGLLAAAGAPSVGTGSSSGAGASGSGSGGSGSGSGGLLASESAPSVGAEAPASGGSAGSSGVSASSASSSDDDSGDGALDLGATVLPVLARAYWKQAVGGVVALWVLRRLFR